MQMCLRFTQVNQENANANANARQRKQIGSFLSTILERGLELHLRVLLHLCLHWTCELRLRLHLCRTCEPGFNDFTMLTPDNFICQRVPLVQVLAKHQVYLNHDHVPESCKIAISGSSPIGLTNSLTNNEQIS